jgi:ABC-2 type transport system permease protein
MGMTLWKILILIRRDFLEEFSYRLNFFLEIITIGVYSSIFFFVAKIFAGAPAPQLARYGGDYFSFVLIGLAFTGYMNTGLSAFTTTIRNEQLLGTLEVILSTPTPLSLIFSARLLWNFLYSSLHAALYFAFGIIFLKANYHAVNFAAIPLIMILSIAAFNSLGMISAGFILIYKRGDPLNALFGFAASLLGGVYFPVEIMPTVLQKAAAFIPVTYALRLMRDACIRGVSLRQLAPDLLILTALCAALVPAGFMFFAYAVRRTKRDGSLTHY